MARYGVCPATQPLTDYILMFILCGLPRGFGTQEANSNWHWFGPVLRGIQEERMWYKDILNNITHGAGVSPNSRANALPTQYSTRLPYSTSVCIRIHVQTLLVR